MLTPSSNTVLEPLTSAMLQDVPDVSAHFGRFRVLKIALDADALDQFTSAPMLDAASMLADAKMHTICWNGTSSGWLGFAADDQLCAEIEERTGIVACTSVLALNEILQLTNATRIAGNYSFGEYTQEQIADMCRKVAQHKPQAICIFCTNFRGAAVAPIIEKEIGIPVYDTVSTALWKSLQVCDIKPSVIKGWGSIFDVA